MTGIARPLGGLRDDLEIVGVELDVRVGAAVVQRRRDGAVLHREHDLGQSTRARGRLHVAVVRLDRSEQHRRAGEASATDHAAQGVGLDGIAEDGPGAVGLHVVDGARIDRGVGIGVPQDVDLRLGVRGRQAVRATVAVDRRARDDREDVIAVTTRVGQSLQDEQSAALGADESVRVGGERLHVSVRRLGADLVETERRRRVDDHVDAAGQREVGFAGPQAADGLMDGHQRRRARGVEGDRRSAEVVEVGHPVRDDRGGGAGQRIRGRVLGALAQAEGRQQLVVVRGGADEHTDRRTLEIARRDVRVLECLPGQLERETLLRVDHLDLARTHLEEVGVERADVVEIAALGVGRVEDLDEPGIGPELRPPIRGQVRDTVDAGDQRVPRRLGRRARLREPGRQPDDRDVVVRGALAPPEGVRVAVGALVGIALDDALRERGDRRMVVDDRRGEDHAGLVLDVGGERHGVARRETELLHGTVDGDLLDGEPGRL